MNGSEVHLIFPHYRKLSNYKSFYKILSEKEFEEIQIVGSSAITTKTTATKYPEIVRINYMLECIAPFESSTKEEFEIHRKT